MQENNENKYIKSILHILNVALIITILVLFFAIYGSQRTPKVVAESVADEKQWVQIQNVSVTGKAAYVYDVVNKRVLYKKNELEQLPLASLTKLMMALTASDFIAQNTDIKIRKEFLNEEGDNGLLANESWNLSNLLDFSLVVSSNDGARSIASVIGATKLNTTDYDLGRKEFIKEMNAKAKELGLSQTYFINESGLDIGGTSGGYGTAIDIANLLRYVLENKPELLEATKYKKIEVDSVQKAHVGKNTNQEVEGIPGLMASKTGYTELAGGNLAVAFDASMGRPIIVVVLGSTQDGRFKDVQTLVNASLEIISK